MTIDGKDGESNLVDFEIFEIFEMQDNLLMEYSLIIPLVGITSCNFGNQRTSTLQVKCQLACPRAVLTCSGSTWVF